MGFKIIYYVGIGLTIVALILSVITFVKLNVLEAIRDIFGTDLNPRFKSNKSTKKISSKGESTKNEVVIEAVKEVEIEEVEEVKKIEVVINDIGEVEDETNLLEEDTGLLDEDTGLLEEDTGLLEEDTGLLEEDTGLLINDHGFTNNFVEEIEIISVNTEDII